jgi:hypothetical protein
VVEPSEEPSSLVVAPLVVDGFAVVIGALPPVVDALESLSCDWSSSSCGASLFSAGQPDAKANKPPNIPISVKFCFNMLLPL